MPDLPSREHFELYEDIRQGGYINMMDVKAGVKLTGLTRAEWIAVLKNYDALVAKYPDVREIR